MNATLPVIRRATLDDAAACQAIYAPYVRDTVISLEEAPPSVEEMRGRIEAALATHDWLVLEADGEIRGYAYGGTYRTRAAYRWACEVSVYLEPGRPAHRGRADCSTRRSSRAWSTVAT